MNYQPTADGGKVHADAWSTEAEAAMLQTSERKRAHWALIVAALRAGRRHSFHRPSRPDARPGLTDDELRREMLATTSHPQSKSGPATRRGELTDLGFVRPQRDDEGRIVKRPSDLGNAMIVWELVPADEYVPPAHPVRGERTANEAALEVARRWATWNLGDPGVASEVIRAYLNPAKVSAELDAEGA